MFDKQEEEYNPYHISEAALALHGDENEVEHPTWSNLFILCLSLILSVAEMAVVLYVFTWSDVTVWNRLLGFSLILILLLCTINFSLCLRDKCHESLRKERR